MADFTREEVIQVIEGGRKCVGADLQGVDLSGADLGGANLSRADLRGAKYDANTKWPVLPQPEGFDPEAAGAVLVGG
jgi:uncharacterized protein YjbI with pentapeptide repeats